MGNMALEWNDVTFSVRQGFWMKNHTILHNISIAVPAGTVLGLVGPNGAGKTTTIKLGAGLMEPESGNVLIYAQSATATGARKCLGLLTETQYIYPHLRLREWLVMLAGFSGLKGSRRIKRVDDVLALLELTDISQQMMLTLSKGQLQRSGLAQALVHEPDILLLDEPMSGLDPYWRYRIQKILLDFKSAGGTILFSSHILADVERLSDQVILLEQGRIRWMGSLTDMPRKIKGYEVLVRAESPDKVEPFADNGKMVLQPKGEWSISVSVDKKDALLRLASEGMITVESLRPIQEEIEEVLFGFTAGKDRGREGSI